jgi:hypothetical protein
MVKITNDIIRLLKDGKNFSEIAFELGHSRNTIKDKFRNYIENHPLAVPTNLWGVSPKDIRKIVQRKEDGDSVEDIAADSDKGIQ